MKDSLFIASARSESTVEHLSNNTSKSCRQVVPLRVLHVTHLDGANYYLNNLFDHLDRREVESSVLTFGPAGAFTEQLEQRGIRTYALNCPVRRKYMRAARSLWKLIKPGEVDIVHTHLFDPTIIGLVIAKLRGRPLIVTRHHSDAVHCIPNRIKRSTYLFLERLVNRWADHIIAPSRTVREVLVERERVPAEKVSIIPYGQTNERFATVTPEAIAHTRSLLNMSDGLSLLYTARLYEHKGHAYLFEAFAELVRKGLNATLYLVGVGPELNRLESLGRQWQIAHRLRFLGWRDDALNIIAASDIVVHPSLEDALSSALIEALMLGRPIIASDISGARDILGDSEYGMIVPPADAVALRVALEQMIKNLDQARERAARGRWHILNYMDASRVARDHVTCYRRVAGVNERAKL